MNRDEVKEVFKVIKNVYSQFEVTTEKLDIWFKYLKDQNPATVMRNVERFVLESKFPPTIADLRETRREEHKSDFLAKLKQWERESCGGKPAS